MENEQIQKRVDWLDEERRKDKSTIASMEDRIGALENSLATANKLVQELSSELSQFRSIFGKVDQVETTVTQLRSEMNRSFEEVERVRKDREAELVAYRQTQFEGVHKQIADLKSQTEQINSINNQLTSRADEDVRLGRKIDELKASLLEVKREDEDVTRSIRLIEEGRRRDEKRLTDLQGEALALRKRADEQRGKLDITADGLRKVENRVAEISTVEVERREAYNTFIEKQTLAQVDRDRKWSEWQTRFETIEKQAMEFEERVQELHTTQRDVRRAQELVEDVAERVERRINEITEMQRLGEDRFRQEWTTFKADDQKRWTNYTLTQDEMMRDANRTQNRQTERMTTLEEGVQNLDDKVAQINEQTELHLQKLLALVRDWASDHEQVFGSTGR